MSCEEVIELLPWYENRTLGPEEHRRVSEHLAGCKRCAGELEGTREAFVIYGAHLSSEALVAIAGGEAAPSDLAARHLVDCSACGEQLALVRDSFSALEEEPAAAGGQPARPATSHRPDAGPVRVSRWRELAIAASLAGVVAGAGWIASWQQAARLEGRVAVLEGQNLSFAEEALLQANLPVPELSPHVLRDPEAEVRVVRLAPGTPALALVLLSDLPARQRTAELRLLAADGRELLRVPGLERDPEEGYFSLLLPVSRLEAGLCSIELRFREPGAAAVIETYRLRIEVP